MFYCLMFPKPEQIKKEYFSVINDELPDTVNVVRTGTW